VIFLLLKDGKAQPRGYADSERLQYGELVYSGVVRTSLMALATTAPFAGEWVGIMAEHFATTADVYRITGELPAYADQSTDCGWRRKKPSRQAPGASPGY